MQAAHSSVRTVAGSAAARACWPALQESFQPMRARGGNPPPQYRRCGTPGGLSVVSEERLSYTQSCTVQARKPITGRWRTGLLASSVASEIPKKPVMPVHVSPACTAYNSGGWKPAPHTHSEQGSSVTPLACHSHVLLLERGAADHHISTRPQNKEAAPKWWLGAQGQRDRWSTGLLARQVRGEPSEGCCCRNPAGQMQL